MAARLNTRFILILFCVIALAGGSIAALAFLSIRGNPVRAMRAGDALMVEGEYLRAMHMYGRAVNREPANPEYRNKMQDALDRIVPESGHQAEELYHLYLGVLEHHATYSRNDPEAYLNLIREWYQYARYLNHIDLWRQVYSHSNRMLQRLPEGEPGREYGLLFRSLATYRRMSVATSEEIERAENDLAAFLELHPDSDLGLAELIRGRMSRYQHLVAQGRTREAQDAIRRIDQAVERSREATDARGSTPPESRGDAGSSEQNKKYPEIALARAVRLLLAQQRGHFTVTPEQRQQHAAFLLEQIRDLNNPLVLVESIVPLANLDPEIGVTEITGLLEAYVEENPEQLLHRVALARLYHMTNQPTKARTHAEQLLATPMLTVSLQARVQHPVRIDASGLICDIEFRRWEFAGSDERARIVEQLEKDVQRLAQLASRGDEDPAVIRARGMLAVTRGEFRRAVDHFERLFRQQSRGDRDPTALRLSALALETIGQTGLARQRLEEALEARPTDQIVLFNLARLTFALREFDEARDYAQQVLRQNPDHQPTIDLVAALERTVEESRIAGAGGIPASSASGQGDVASTLERAWTQIRTGDTSNAYMLIVQHLAADDLTDDDRQELNIAAARASLLLGDIETARRHVDDAERIDETHPALSDLKESLAFDDPVELIRRNVQRQYGDQPDSEVLLLVTLMQVRDQWNSQRQQAESDGRTAVASRLRDMTERIDRELQQIGTRVREEHRDHPAIFEMTFNEAIREQRWSDAERVVDRARQMNLDQANGLTYRARYQLARGRNEDAVRTLIDVTQRLTYSSPHWRMLGNAYRRVGNMIDAERAYQQAFEINPNDLQTLLEFADLMLAAGNRERAATLMRRARELAPHHPGIRSQWLLVEQTIGNTTVVLRERRRIDASPDSPETVKRTNAIELANLLLTARPTRLDVADMTGDERLEDLRRWQAVGANERTRLLRDVRRAWLEEARRIAQRLAAEGEPDLSLVQLEAQLRRAEGNYPAGAERLRSFMESQTGEQRVRAAFALADYYMRENSFGDAVMLLDSLRQSEHDPGRQADHMLANILMDHGRAGDAATLFARYLEVDPDNVQVRLRRAEALIRANQFEEAEAELKKVADAGHDSLDLILLRSGLAAARADQFARTGRDDDYRRQLRAEREHLATAERRYPASPMPHVQMALSHFREFQRTGRQREYDDALLALRRAEQVQAEFSRTYMVRAEILWTAGERRSAMSELERLLEREPFNTQARQRLVQMGMETGRHDAVIQTINRAIEREPGSAAWYERMGDVLVATGRSGEAIGWYRAAYELRPSPGMLARVIDTMLRQERPDFRAAAELYASAPEEFRRSQPLMLQQADVQLGLGRRDQALNLLAEIGDILDMEITGEGEGEVGTRQDAARVQGAISAWFASAARAFGIMTNPTVENAERLEAFVMELTDSSPRYLVLDQLAAVWQRVGEQGRSRAIALQATAIENMPERAHPQIRAMLYNRYGVLLYLQGEHSAAAEAWTAQVQDDPDNATALNNLAFILARYLNQPDRALGYAKRANELEADNPNFLDTLGVVYLELGRIDDSLRTLRRVIEIDEGSAAGHLHLAQALLAQGERDSARRHLDRAAELSTASGDTQLQEQVAETRSRLD